MQLSLVAASLTQLIFTDSHATRSSIRIDDVARVLGIHWYRPGKLTRGLMVACLRALIHGRLFSSTTLEGTYSQEVNRTLDKAA